MASNGGLLGNTFTCLICSQEGLSEDEMKTHVLLEHVECNACCPFCDLSNITSDEMNLHINAVHFDDLMSPTEPSDVSVGVPGEEPPALLTEEEYGGAKPKQKTSGLKHSQSLDHGCAPLPESPRRRNNMKSSQSETSLSSRSKLQLNFPSVVNPGPSKRSSSFHMNMDGVMEGESSCEKSSSIKRERSLHSNLKLDSDIVVEEKESQTSDNTVPMEAVANGATNTEHRSIIVPDINQNVEPDINSNIPAEFSCPLCQFLTSSENLIQSHVNIAHLDIISPASANANGPVQGMENHVAVDSNTMHVDEYPCPICQRVYFNSGELSLHVNSQHANIFSPDKEEKMDLPKPENDRLEFTCPVCDQKFAERFKLQSHVNGHFSAEQTPVHERTDKLIAMELEVKEKVNQEQKEFQQLQALYGMTNGTPFKKQYEKNLERAVSRGDLSVMEYHEKRTGFRRAEAQGVDDGSSCTKGVIQRLQEYYKTPTHGVARSWLCTAVDHYAGSYGDKGWGCGYRNFQMLLSSLATEPTYNKILFSGRQVIPSIPKIQRLIESAWGKGFDKQGSEQLGGKVFNSTKWIGATEIVATLASLKVKCRLLDFHNPSGPQGTHTKLFEWVKQYFEKPAAFKPPLYLQHQGHSRTIIGIEELKDKSLRLLIFDPSTSKKQINLFHSIINANIMRMLRRTLGGLKAKQYQIVAVEGIISDKDYDAHKILKSERLS